MSQIEHEHLTREMLERSFGTVPIEDVGRMLLHLLAVCPECREASGTILAAYEAGAIGLQFSSGDVALFASRTAAGKLWETLEPLTFEETLSLVRIGEEYVSWGLSELLAPGEPEGWAPEPLPGRRSRLSFGRGGEASV